MRGRALLYPIAVLAITVSGFAIEDPSHCLGPCFMPSASPTHLAPTFKPSFPLFFELLRTIKYQSPTPCGVRLFGREAWN